MVEKIIFNLFAIVLFIAIFAIMAKRNDTNYLSMLLFEAVGIGINFVELNFKIDENTLIKILEYILAIVLPIVLLILEKKGKKYSELLTMAKVKYYLVSNKDEKAKKALINLVTKYPESFIGRKNLAKLYEKLGELEDAIFEYSEACELDSTDFVCNYKMAELFNKLGKNKEAENILNDLIKREPDYYDASMLLGDILYSEGRFKEAVNVYMDSLRYYPEDYELYYNLGMVYIRLNNFQDAKNCYAKAAEINSKLYNAYYVLGELSLIAKDLDEAEKYFTQSLYDAVEADSYYELARIYMLKKDRGNAITFVQKAIELNRKYYKIAKKEPIFIPIKQYIVEPDGVSIIDKTLDPKEIEINETLVKTVSIIEKIGKKTVVENEEKKKVSEEKEHEKEEK